MVLPASSQPANGIITLAYRAVNTLNQKETGIAVRSKTGHLGESEALEIMYQNAGNESPAEILPQDNDG